MRSRTMTEVARSQAVLAYWLLPAPPAREFLRETIARLAKQCDAPIFKSHLTLAIGSDSATERISHPHRHHFRADPIGAAGVHFGSRFTKALFVRFDPRPELDRLRNSLGLERCTDQPFDPHVSLLYQTMTPEKQSPLAASVRFPFQTVRFDAIEIVRCRLPVTTSADVTSWEVIASRRLKD